MKEVGCAIIFRIERQRALGEFDVDDGWLVDYDGGFVGNELF